MKKRPPMLLLALLLPVFFMLSLFSPPTANSATISYYLDINNAGIVGGPWGMVTLTEYDAHRVDFTVDPFASAFSSTSNFGLQTFGFNESTLDGTKLSITNLSAGWSWGYDENKKIGFGPYQKFDLKTDGTGGDRQDPLTFSVISPADFEIDISKFTTELSTAGYLFAGHIAGFTASGSTATSAYFSTTGVPTTVAEPATMLLLGFGLVGMGVASRRRFVK